MKKIIKKKKKKQEIRVEKINLQDETITVFEKINESNYYKPLNQNALDYLKNEYEKYQKDELHTIEYTIIDENEAFMKKFEINLIKKLLNEIEIKNKGLVKITPNILVYITEDLTPLNSNAEENQKYLTKLITQSPIYCEEAWLNINKNFESYFTLI